MQWSFKFTKVSLLLPDFTKYRVVYDLWHIKFCVWRMLPTGPSWSLMLCIRPWITGTPWHKRMQRLPSILIKLSLLGTSFMKLTVSTRESFIRWNSISRALKKRKPSFKNNYKLPRPVSTWTPLDSLWPVIAKSPECPLTGPSSEQVRLLAAAQAIVDVIDPQEGEHRVVDLWSSAWKELLEGLLTSRWQPRRTTCRTCSRL